MDFRRRVLHYGPGPSDFKSVISERAIAGCWFELHRQGGCGAGELRLKDDFLIRNEIEIGDWISLEFDTGDRWYMGRVERRTAGSPAQVSFRLQGMGVELGEVFPGGFAPDKADGVPPHRYARTDLFPNDPDRDLETFDAVSQPHEVVQLLMQQYVVPRTHIALDTSLIEASVGSEGLTSLKFRGEESVRSIIKELAVRVFNASWGVRSDGKFFFLQKRATLLTTFREGRDIVSLEESRDRELLFNRVVLTGGYVYDEEIRSDLAFRGFYRWRGNYIQPTSRAQHGERRIRIWIPWIRTQEDSHQFVKEFFRVYAQPTSRYLVEVANQSLLRLPWEGAIRIEDRNGTELITAPVETIRVQFDHAPRFRLELGPEDPHTHWPEPPHDERWEIPGDQNAERGQGGSEITFSSSSMISSESSTVSSGTVVSSSGSQSMSVSESDAPTSSGSEVSSSAVVSSSGALSSGASSSGMSSSGMSSSGMSSSGMSSSGMSSSGMSSAGSSSAVSSGGSSSASSSIGSSSDVSSVSSVDSLSSGGCLSGATTVTRVVVETSSFGGNRYLDCVLVGIPQPTAINEGVDTADDEAHFITNSGDWNTNASLGGLTGYVSTISVTVKIRAKYQRLNGPLSTAPQIRAKLSEGTAWSAWDDITHSPGLCDTTGWKTHVLHLTITDPGLSETAKLQIESTGISALGVSGQITAVDVIHTYCQSG